MGINTIFNLLWKLRDDLKKKFALNDKNTQDLVILMKNNNNKIFQIDLFFL